MEMIRSEEQLKLSPEENYNYSKVWKLAVLLFYEINKKKCLAATTNKSKLDKP